jgi:hypothetical protein
LGLRRIGVTDMNNSGRTFPASYGPNLSFT